MKTYREVGEKVVPRYQSINQSINQSVYNTQGSTIEYSKTNEYKMKTT